MTLTLMKLPTAFGLRNASPFNLKAEALLELSKLPYETVEALPNKGPKGKLPALIDGDNVIGDSTIIQKYLENTHGLDLDCGLTKVQMADAEAYKKMAEEYLYFIALYIRWLVFPNITKDAFFGSIPWPIQGFVFGGLKRKVRRTLYGQGIGRHSEEEIYQFGNNVIDALADRIGEGPFFFGDQVRSIDTALYPQLINVIGAPYETPFKLYALKKKNLVDYCEKCELRIFGGV